jgi:hypothetical protein
MANGHVGDITHGAYFMIEYEVPSEQNKAFDTGDHATLPLTHRVRCMHENYGAFTLLDH